VNKEVSDPQAGRSRWSELAVPFTEKYTLVGLLVVLFVVFAALKPDVFPTSGNLQALLSGEAIDVVVALAIIVPLVAGNFDLSIGSNLTMSSLLFAGLMPRQGFPLIVAMGASSLFGAAVGAVNGLLVAVAKVNSLVVTLAVGTVLSGIVQWYSNGEIVQTGLSQAWLRLGTDIWFGVPAIAVVAVACALVVVYVLDRTPYGRRLVSIGSNEEAAHLVGVRVSWNVFASFVASGFLAAAAGMLEVAQQGSGNPQVGGIDAMLAPLAGVFLGATVFRPGRYNVPGAIVGLFVVAVLADGLSLVGVESWVQPILNGAAVVIAVTLSTTIRRKRSGSLQA
jgi:ribose transport system permease protein